MSLTRSFSEPRPDRPPTGAGSGRVLQDEGLLRHHCGSQTTRTADSKRYCCPLIFPVQYPPRSSSAVPRRDEGRPDDLLLQGHAALLAALPDTDLSYGHRQSLHQVAMWVSSLFPSISP